MRVFIHLPTASSGGILQHHPVAFHSNAIGNHLNAYRTLHRIRLHYYWPGMYSYIKQMCAACPGCTLANTTKSKSSELVYNFPIEVTFLVLFVDA